MFDYSIRKRIDPVVDWVTRPLVYTKVTANQITLVGFVIGMLAVPALAWALYIPALICICINRIFDGVDGTHARRTGSSDLGGYLDIVCDFIFYAAVVFGFGLADPNNIVAANWLIFSFVGTGSSFLAYAIVAEKLGISEATLQNKTLHYLGGLTEGTETIAFFVFVCLLPEYFRPAAWVFGCLCWITTATRVYRAALDFGVNRGR